MADELGVSVRLAGNEFSSGEIQDFLDRAREIHELPSNFRVEIEGNGTWFTLTASSAYGRVE